MKKLLSTAILFGSIVFLPRMAHAADHCPTRPDEPPMLGCVHPTSPPNTDPEPVITCERVIAEGQPPMAGCGEFANAPKPKAKVVDTAISAITISSPTATTSAPVIVVTYRYIEMPTKGAW